MSPPLSRTYATPLRLEPGVSRRLGGFLMLSHGAALAVLPFCGLPPLPVAAIALGVVLSWLRTRRREVLRRDPDAIHALVWEEGNRVRLTLRSGQETGATLRPFVYMQPRLVILHFRRDDGHAARLVLLPDMLDADSFRRLRVRLLIDMKRLAVPGAR
jgi:Membrane-bound toxin component of toxin-antitoxin system